MGNNTHDAYRQSIDAQQRAAGSAANAGKGAYRAAKNAPGNVRKAKSFLSGIRGAAAGLTKAAAGAAKLAAAAWPYVLAACLILLVVLVVRYGLPSAITEPNEMPTANGEKTQNMPKNKEERQTMTWDWTPSLEEALNLSEIVQNAKREEIKSIQKKYPGATIVCESDQTPILISGEEELYGATTMPSATAGSSSGQTTSSNPAIQASIEWARKLAADNRFTYGKGYRDYFYCPVCKGCTNKSDLQYTCNPFVAAAFAHGTQDHRLMKNGYHRISTWDWNFEDGRDLIWQKVGTCRNLSFSDLQPGDILIEYTNGIGGHACIYGGGDELIEATSSSGIVDNKKGAKSRFESYQRRSSKNYVMRYIGSGTGRAATSTTYTKKDKYTQLKVIGKNTGVRYQIGMVFGTEANCAQSFAATGNGFAVSIVTHDHSPGYIRLLDEIGKTLTTKRADEIGHANASCITADGNLIVAGVKSGSSTSAYQYSLADGSMKGKSLTLPDASYSVAYDRQTERYIFATAGTFRVYDKDMKTKITAFSRSAHSLAYCQDIGAGHGYIFACHTAVGGKGSENWGKNYIDVYNESTGDYCGSYFLNYGEIESADIVDGELVLLVHILGNSNYIQYTGINVGGGSIVGGVTGRYTTKHDLDIITAYEATISNSGLYKIAEEEGGTGLIEDDYGDKYSEQYVDINGRKIKTYRTDEEVTKIDYKSDLKAKLGGRGFWHWLTTDSTDAIEFYDILEGEEAIDQMALDNVSQPGIQTEEPLDEERIKQEAAASTFGEIAGSIQSMVDSILPSAKDSIILVNSEDENAIPNGYDPDLVEIDPDGMGYTAGHDNSKYVARVAKNNLIQMIKDCQAAGHKVRVQSSYRSYSDQEWLYNQAVRDGRTDTAKPGHSEHELGLAVDLIDVNSAGWADPLIKEQEEMPGQIWLMENCYKYGFILRYPENCSGHTLIDYEPWHYRYVGVEVATEIANMLKKKGEWDICLEDYLGKLPSSSASTSTAASSGEIIYLREKPISDILEQMGLPPDDAFSGTSYYGTDTTDELRTSNIEYVLAISDNIERALFKGYAKRQGAQLTGVSLFTGGTLSFPGDPNGVIVTSVYTNGRKRTDVSSASASGAHEGIDLSGGGLTSGKPIYAAHSGVVTIAGYSSGYGNYVIIQGANGLSTRYGHMNSTPLVRSGQSVSSGQTIGYVGNTGNSYGAHLHFEVRIQGKDVNPAPYLGILNQEGYKVK